MRAIERFYQYIDYKGIKPTRFEKKLSLSNGYLGTQLKRKGGLGETILNKIIDNCLDIDIKWLLTGKGSMLKNDASQLTPASFISTKGIPLIPLDAMAGFGTGEMQVMDYDAERYIVPEFEELGVDFMIRAKGSSMYPKYNSGDVVACKKLPLDTFFQWNKVYVLDTIQGPMIKRIHKSAIKDNIVCVSDNSKYQPFDLDLKEVNSLSIVVGVIRLE